MTTKNASSPLRQDIARYGPMPWVLQPALWAVAVYRFGQWTKTAGMVGRILHPAYFLAYCAIRIAVGIDLPRSATIGPGLLIHHFGGVVVNPTAVIGANLEIRHNVTIGSATDGGASPRIGDQVWIGVGASILGGVDIGDGVIVGAHSLVLQSVEAGKTVVGVPAQPL